MNNNFLTFNLPLRFFLFLSSFLLLCSCGKKEVTVIHYKIANCQKYINLRAEPNTSSAIIAKIDIGTEVQLLKRIHEPPLWEYWAEIKIETSGVRGYVKNDFLESWTTKEAVKPPTLAERLSDADQKVTAKLFGFLDTIIGQNIQKSGKNILSKTIIRTKDGSDNNTRIFWVIATLAAALIMGGAIYLCETVQWWHYIIAIAFIPLEILSIMAVIPGSLSVQIDIFILDFIVNLILFILLLCIPALQWYSSYALIGNVVGDEDGGKTYIVSTMILLLAFIVCIRIFPAAGDIFFYIYLALNGILFIILNIAGNSAAAGPFRISFNPRYFLSIRGIFVFLLKIIVSLCSFAFLFILTIYMVLPMIVVSLGLGLMLFCGFIALFTMLSPLGMSTTSSKYSTELRDGSGHFIDTIDSSGWDIGGGGRHYSKGPDGFFRRDN